MLSVSEVLPLPAEEVVPRVAVEVAAEAAYFVPEFRRNCELEKTDAVPEKSNA